MSGEEAGDSEATTLGVLDGLMGYHLRRASNAFGADLARALDGTGMRQVLLGIMSVVTSNPGVNQGSVGRLLGIQRANMVALITELVESGLIDRQTAKGDRRAFALTVTAKGCALFDKCLKRIAAHETGMLADLSAADRETLGVLLRRIEARER